MTIKITLNDLIQAFPSSEEDKLKSALLVIQGEYDSEQLEEEFTDCAGLASQSYHPHAYTHMQMIALNQLLEGHGVEAIEHDDKYYSYINMGDTYCATIFDNGELIITDYGELIITDYGTFIEQLEQESGVQCK